MSKEEVRRYTNSVRWVKVQKNSIYNKRLKEFDLRFEMVDHAHCNFERIKSWQCDNVVCEYVPLYTVHNKFSTTYPY